MIQIKYKNQGVYYLLTLRQVLIDGMNEFCSKSCGSTDCKGCPDYAACSDVHRAIAHLDSMITFENCNH